MVLETIWYQRSVAARLLAALLAPLGWLYAGLARVRRAAYERGWLTQRQLPVPVIVVGNLVAGGTGKTPLVIAICAALVERGYRPALLCRGHGGRSERWPIAVHADSDPHLCGDEAVLLARVSCTGPAIPVFADPDRVRGGLALLAAYPDRDVLVCDDGLQHLRLARDVEVLVWDGQRRAGNGRCLPAGPLREPLAQAARYDLVVVNGDAADAMDGEFALTLEPSALYALGRRPARTTQVAGGADPIDLSWLVGRRVNALCGIGNPRRFLDTLKALDARLEPRIFPDHHAFSAGDLRARNDLPTVMTSKDAVKCERLLAVDPALAEQAFFVLEVRAKLQTGFMDALAARLQAARSERDAPRGPSASGAGRAS
ncbi:MAG: tetraacyldisaccharide 4'-kinase [Gammaproteobacteria bacterium]|nr:tetraacyldisaccharide 4'-kinase [Gammaproteobacteria bacterium]